MAKQKLTLEEKLFYGFERISEVIKSMLWEKAKLHGISPIQIQIILFISKHHTDICNVSSLSKEFDVTKATISDAVRVLIKKELLAKDYSPTDNRRFNLLLTAKGKILLDDIKDYGSRFLKTMAELDEDSKKSTYSLMTGLLSKLNQEGLIKVQRTCFGCSFYNGDKKTSHYCNFINSTLQSDEIRLDCGDYIPLK